MKKSDNIGKFSFWSHPVKKELERTPEAVAVSGYTGRVRVLPQEAPWLAANNANDGAGCPAWHPGNKLVNVVNDYESCR
jgi:hypothetical protein